RARDALGGAGVPGTGRRVLPGMDRGDRRHAGDAGTRRLCTARRGAAGGRASRRARLPPAPSVGGRGRVRHHGAGPGGGRWHTTGRAPPAQGDGMTEDVELTILLPVLDERDNLALLLPRLQGVLARLGASAVALGGDGGSEDGTPGVAAAHGTRVLEQRERGYGAALREGLAAAAGGWVITLDADLSHDPDFIAKLWRARTRADIVIASRYARGGVAFQPVTPAVVSPVLNRCFRTA